MALSDPKKQGRRAVGEESTEQQPPSEANRETRPLPVNNEELYVAREDDQKELDLLDQIIGSLRGDVFKALPLIEALDPEDRGTLDALFREKELLHEQAQSNDMTALDVAKKKRDIYQGIVSEVARIKASIEKEAQQRAREEREQRLKQVAKAAVGRARRPLYTPEQGLPREDTSEEIYPDTQPESPVVSNEAVTEEQRDETEWQRAQELLAQARKQSAQMMPLISLLEGAEKAKIQELFDQKKTLDARPVTSKIEETNLILEKVRVYEQIAKIVERFKRKIKRLDETPTKDAPDHDMVSAVESKNGGQQEDGREILDVDDIVVEAETPDPEPTKDAAKEENPDASWEQYAVQVISTAQEYGMMDENYAWNWDEEKVKEWLGLDEEGYRKLQENIERMRVTEPKDKQQSA